MSSIIQLREKLSVKGSSPEASRARELLYGYISGLSKMESLAEMEITSLTLSSGTETVSVSTPLIREEGNGFMYTVDDDGARGESLTSSHEEWSPDSPLMKLAGKVRCGADCEYSLGAYLNCFYDASYGSRYWQDLAYGDGVYMALMEKEEWDDAPSFFRLSEDGLAQVAPEKGLSETLPPMKGDVAVCIYAARAGQADDIMKLRQMKKLIDGAAVSLRLSESCPDPEDEEIYYEAESTGELSPKETFGLMKEIMDEAYRLKLKAEVSCILEPVDPALPACVMIESEGTVLTVSSLML